MSKSGSKPRDVFVFERVETLKANESKYIKPHRIHYKMNGKDLIWDCMKIHDSVAILVYNRSSKKLVFVRQLRPAIVFAQLCQSIDSIDLNVFSKENIHKVNQMFEKNPNFGYTLELCAGILDKQGKTPQEVAKEEIAEEIGYVVDLKDETPKGKGGGIDDESIEVIELGIEEVRQLLYCDDTTSAISRPTAMLFALSWFLYQHLPTIS
ncbi:unnamed protein product [Medioppia subpectinata]|uniref:Nudix hydrolase domain-containing protein n=1 Tax=Medioppia subpectinata TaxID=1979941 RepID=A0A7R9KN75_9ACAR|nr:unnamed protein product [Medioppia subpectinata]CAG2106661.1 unnamed protein product [Medioppia subpectinata]